MAGETPPFYEKEATMGIWAIIIGWLLLAIIFGSGSGDPGNNPFANN